MEGNNEMLSTQTNEVNSRAGDGVSPLEKFEDALRAAGSTKDRRGRWRCPVAGHGRGRGDVHPSLCVDEGREGRVLVHCEAGCATEAVVAAIGRQMGELSPNSSETRATAQRRTRSLDNPQASTVAHHAQCSESGAARLQCSDLTLEAYASAKGFPVGFLTKLGIRQVPYQGGTALRIPYFDEGGEEAAIRFRLRLAKNADADGRFKWRTGSKTMPYGLWRLSMAQATQGIVLVEGESDAHTLWLKGIPALAIPGANTWKPEWASCLEGIPTVFAVRETDAAGSAFIGRLLATPALRDRLRIVDLPTKDANELYQRDPDGFEVAFAEALDQSTVAVEEERTAAEAKRSALADVAWANCAHLAQHPNILDLVFDTMHQLGVAGDCRLARITYLAATSRLLRRPVSIVAKGPSSAGKTHETQQALKLFPPEAFYALTAASEHALAYGEEPLEHRMIVVYEASGVDGDFASYLLRSLLSEGCIRYETVEKTKDGLRARLIERPGPTGAILTTTRISLHPEVETRLLSVPVDDSPEQTRRVLLALADDGPGDLDLEPWHALQAWLQTAGIRSARIPYQRALAERIPPVAVRLRRDFGLLLSLVRAHALLHQASRERTDDGSVVAALEDYAAVRELVGDLIGEASEVSVTPRVRETVAAVQELVNAGAEDISLRELAQVVNVDKATISRRVRAAVAAGYLRNLEERRGRPARIVLADPLPDPAELLPSPEILGEALQASSEPLQADAQHSTSGNSSGNGKVLHRCSGTAGASETYAREVEFEEGWL